MYVMLYLADVFLEAFLAESCSPSLSSLLLSFRSSSSILRYKSQTKFNLCIFIITAVYSLTVQGLVTQQSA